MEEECLGREKREVDAEGRLRKKPLHALELPKTLQSCIPAACAATPPPLASSTAHVAVNPAPARTTSHNTSTNDGPPPATAARALHPRVAIILGVDRRWYAPLLICRALSTGPAAWGGLKCAWALLELLLVEAEEMLVVESRIRVTEIFLAILWCCASAYLSFFFTDCLMSRWLLNYTPQATLVRLLTVNAINAYSTSWVLYLSGGSEDSRLLLPAWVSIASTLTVCYHVTQRNINIKKETTASISVFSLTSFATMCTLLLQSHLTRVDATAVPLFVIIHKFWSYIACLVMGLLQASGR